MKKNILFFGSITILALASCHKVRNCEVTTYTKSNEQTMVNNYPMPETMSKKAQKAECESLAVENTQVKQTVVFNP